MPNLTFNEIFYVILLALLPVSEVRGAIPLAYYVTNDSYLRLYLIIASTIANCLIPVILIPSLKRLEGLILHLSNRNAVVARFFKLYTSIVDNARRKAQKYLSKWGYLGLTIFVAIPLPGTGAWTGSLVAYVFNLDKVKSIISVVTGVIIASILITLAMEGVLTFLKVLL